MNDAQRARHNGWEAGTVLQDRNNKLRMLIRLVGKEYVFGSEIFSDGSLGEELIWYMDKYRWRKVKSPL